MNIPWLIFVTVCILLIQNKAYNKFSLKHIDYRRSFSKRAVFEGEQIELIDEISNKKLLPLLWLQLESKIHRNLLFQQKGKDQTEVHNEQFHRTLFSLMPYQKITRKQKVTCKKRGFYQIKSVGMSSGDALGFSIQTKLIKASAEVIVYPKILSLKEMDLPSNSWMGDLIVKRWIIDDPFVVAGTRDYTYGDPMKAVNWKATARANRLQVNKKDFTADHHLMIYLNFDQFDDHWLPVQDEALVEKGIRYAATIAQHAISAGISTGFGCNSLFGESDSVSNEQNVSVRMTPRNGKAHLQSLLETMAKLKTEKNKSFNLFLREDINQETTGLDILIITSIVNDKLEDNIRKLEHLGNSIQLLILKKDNHGPNIFNEEEGVHSA